MRNVFVIGNISSSFVICIDRVSYGLGVELLPTMHKALGSIPTTAKNKKNKKGGSWKL